MGLMICTTILYALEVASMLVYSFANKYHYVKKETNMARFGENNHG